MLFPSAPSSRPSPQLLVLSIPSCSSTPFLITPLPFAFRLFILHAAHFPGPPLTGESNRPWPGQQWQEYDDQLPQAPKGNACDTLVSSTPPGPLYRGRPNSTLYAHTHIVSLPLTLLLVHTPPILNRHVYVCITCTSILMHIHTLFPILPGPPSSHSPSLSRSFARRRRTRSTRRWGSRWRGSRRTTSPSPCSTCRGRGDTGTSGRRVYNIQ